MTEKINNPQSKNFLTINYNGNEHLENSSLLNENINQIIPYLFLNDNQNRNNDIQIFSHYIKYHFNFNSKLNNISNISLKLFYNYLNLPFYISEKIYNGFLKYFDNNPNIQNFINFLIILYFGDLDDRINLLFHILNFENNNKILKKDIKIFFCHFHLIKKSNKEEINNLINIIDCFYENNEYLDEYNFKKKILNSNSNLFYLFYFLINHYSPFEYEGINYFYENFGKKDISSCNSSYDSDNILDNKQVKYEQLIDMTHELIVYFNNSYNLDFSFDEPSFDELNQFEEDITEIKKISNYFEKNVEKNFKFLTPIPSKYNSSLITNVPNLRKFSENLTRIKKHFNIPKKEKSITLKCDFLCKNYLKEYNLILKGNDIFITNDYNKLIFMIPIQKIFLSIENKKKGNQNNKNQYNLIFNSFIHNIHKKYQIFINNLTDIEKIKNYIKSKLNFYEFPLKKYKFKNLIGKGSFGEVFKAIDVDLHLDVAIKKIKKLEENEILFQNEKEISFFLKNYPYCENIIKIYNIYEDIEYIYIVMEYINNGNLKNFLIVNKINNDLKCFLIIKIAKVIEFLHFFGILHRDLKCENILINKYNNNITPKIIDFGLSVVLNENEYLLESYGTKIYISPEILLKEKYNKSYDIWCFGIICYIIIYNKHPFVDNENFYENILFDNILNKIIIFNFNQNKNKENYNEINEILEKCLDKNKKNRPNILTIIKALSNYKHFRKYNYD